jgi:polysaccharide export outer membrane protein
MMRRGLPTDHYEFVRIMKSRILWLLPGLVLLSGCSTWPAWLPMSGPSAEQITAPAEGQTLPNILLVQASDEVARQLLRSRELPAFSTAFGMGVPYEPVMGRGDIVEISIWEAPPAMLFGGAQSMESVLSPPSGGMVTFPEQMVNSQGMISLPFTGPVHVAGRCARDIETDIANRLREKANQPQVMVRTIHNNTAIVTVVGDVTTNTKVPLTAKGERLLDALAAAGGVRQSVDRTTIQLARGNKITSLPLGEIIEDPEQNIFLRPGDVVTALYQPLSFTMLGAAGASDEIKFEAQGISLAKALARAGGLKDERADADGLFIFRYEKATALNWSEPPIAGADGKVPVVYQVDLRDPSTFFVAQNFPIEDGDLLYVANSPAAELEKFLRIAVGAFVYPSIALVRVAN